MNIFKRLAIITLALIATIATAGIAYAKPLYGWFQIAVYPGSTTIPTEVAAHSNKLYYVRCTVNMDDLAEGYIQIQVGSQKPQRITKSQWQVEFNNIRPIYNTYAQNGELHFKFIGSFPLKGKYFKNDHVDVNCSYSPQK